MRSYLFFAIPAMAVLLGSCCDALPKSKGAEQAATNGVPALGLFALKASNGSYVSCAMTPDSTGHVLLQANKPGVGPNEVFTAKYLDDGRLGIQAPNGKIVTVDRNFGGILTADRDYVGEWETFEIVDVDSGVVALRNTNSQFVGAHYELPSPNAAALIADKAQANEWEHFTIVRDPAIGQ